MSCSSCFSSEVDSGHKKAMSWRFEYDDNNRITKITNPGNHYKEFQYEFDKEQRLEKVVRNSPDGSRVILKFNKQGLLNHMADDEGEIQYRYDEWRRLSSVQREESPIISYEYDTQDRITSLQVGHYYRVDYKNDFLGRLKSMDTPAGTVKYEYQTGQNEVIRTLPNGVKTFWKRQVNGQLESITHGYFKHPEDTSYTVLAKYTYGHAPDGRIATIREQSSQGDVVKQYSYDTMGRLVRAIESSGRQYGYEYDQVGNRTKATATGKPGQYCTYDWAGRLTSINSKPCTYDASGNLTKFELDGTLRRYRFNTDNRLAEATVGDQTVQYRYDGHGRLVVRKSAESETRFIPDPLSPYWQPLAIEESDGTRTLVIWDGAVPLATIKNGKTEWLLHDHLGSVRAIVDGTGKLKRYRDYAPFGTPANNDPTSTLEPAFAGLFCDDASGATLALARAYMPKLGQFHQPDPQKKVPGGSPMDTSPYTYCGGEPVGFTDRDGKDPAPVNQSEKPLDFLRYANGNVIYAHFNNVQVVGLGTGKLADTEEGRQKLLADAEGRFQLIDTTASGAAGGIHDLIEYTLTGGRQWSGAPWKANWTADFSLAHSGGAHLQQPATARIFRVDPSSQGALSHDEIDLPNLVAGLTSLEFQRASDTAPGFGLRAKFDSNPLEAIWESARDVMSFPSGLVTAAENTARYWGHTFYTHSFTDKYDDPKLKNFIAPKDTYNHVQIQTRDGRVFHYERESPRDPWKYQATTRFPLSSDPTIPHRNSNPVNPLLPRPPQRHSAGISDQISSRSHELADFIMSRIALAREAQRLHPYNPNEDLGRVASLSGRSGFAAPSSIAQMETYRRLSASVPKPSSVGGVYLGGAVDSIEGLGTLKGVRLDANGNLVLVGDDGGDIKLPPLRLDDVVTIFRSVYIHGEGPSVTIDPNPVNPENSAMIIRHGKGTEDTYVGWVLYEADRLMKGYTQGVDNKTEKSVESKVPGYADVLETIYFGGADPRKEQKEGIWERFWIVPAEARRFEGMRKELTLFDVPLKVKTQKMKWIGGELVDDKQGTSSSGATAFTNWFTKNYDGIAAEQYLLPPSESGITNPVPVFRELRRIALTTAIAEKLRDQGVPMPFWMRDYEVRKVPFEKFTPGMEVTRTKQDGNMIRQTRIFGGVELMPEDKVVKTYASVADAKEAPKEVRAKVEREVKLASELEQVLVDKPSEIVPLLTSSKEVVADGHEFKVAAMPGAETKALGPCRLDEVDVAVPIPGGGSIQLVRSFNSFFNPKGPWGKGWALNLPRLEQVTVPIKRDGNKVATTKGYELITPLNSYYARFLSGKPVKSFAHPDRPDVETSSPFDGMYVGKPDFFKNLEIDLIQLKDGRTWHFSESGDLIAIEDGALATIYERDGNRRITRIAALQGEALVAQITLGYDREGRLAKATGVDLVHKDALPVEVVYIYNEGGRLAGLEEAFYTKDKRGGLTPSEKKSGRVGYEYTGPWVSSINWRDAGADKSDSVILASYQYNDNGQLVSEQRGEDRRAYSMTATKDGWEASVSNSGVRTYYDSQMRTIKTITDDGTTTAWVYDPDGKVQSTTTAPDGRSVSVTDSADGRERIIQAEGEPKVRILYDEGGRMVSMEENNRKLLSQQWRPDGQLARIETVGKTADLQYGDNAVLESIMLHPPTGESRLTEWQQTNVDRFGRPVAVKDGTGLDLQMGYDADGNLQALVQKTLDGNLGFNIERDGEGRVEKIASSWGDTDYSYSNQGELKKVTTQSNGQTALVELSGNRISKVAGFDGGTTEYSYFDKGELEGFLKKITAPNKLELVYEYDESGYPSQVTMGTERRLVLGYDDEGRLKEWKYAPVNR